MLLLSTNIIHMLLLFLIVSQSIHSQGQGRTAQSQLGTQLIYLGLNIKQGQDRNLGYTRYMNEARP